MWTGISWASTKASGSPASIAEPSSRPRETSISESWQMQNKPPKSKTSESKFTNSKNSKDTLPWANICHFQTFSSCSHSPHIVCILEYNVIHISFHIMMILMKLSQAQINGAWGCEVRLWSVWCWVHSAGKSQKAQTLQTWAGNSCWEVSMLSNIFFDQVRWECDLCKSTFTDQGNLRRHKLTKHEGATYDCYQCPAQFGNHGTLRRHILTEHEGVRWKPNESNMSDSHQ